MKICSCADLLGRSAALMVTAVVISGSQLQPAHAAPVDPAPKPPISTIVADGVGGASSDVAATPDSTDRDPSRMGVDALVDRLVALNPGASADVVKADMALLARKKGDSLYQVLTKAVVEAEGSAVLAGTRVKSGKVALAASGGGGDVFLGNATNVGDIFVTSASTVAIPHGHTGIFYTKTTIVEAPGPQAGYSRSAPASSTAVATPACKESVSTTAAKRTAAANYAYNNYRNLPYNMAFYDNKHETTTCVMVTTSGCRKYSQVVNCSQLVWLAYKLSAAKLDLDGNGGDGVYPWNIHDSSLTTAYATIK